MTTTKYYFISGLPRSGSTLLSAILNQNPLFHADMHSGLAPLWGRVVDEMSTDKEFQTQLNDTQRINILRGMIENYYTHISDGKGVIFDTSRMWQRWVDVLVKLYPNVKIICCVRSVEWISDSLERLHKSRPWAVNYFWARGVGSSTIHDRINDSRLTTNMLGYSLSALSEALKSEYSNHLLLVDYDILTRFPNEVISCIYDWLGEKQFIHDFDNIKFDEPIYDKMMGVQGLHHVRSKIEPNVRETVLPEELFGEMAKLNQMWRGKKDTKANIIQIHKKEPAKEAEK
jgi:sulfotransferase